MKRTKNYSKNQPILYLIATPIGNLGEFSPRAINTIQEMDVLFAEDTRNTSLLLSHFDIKKPIYSLREHNEIEASQNLIKLILEGKKVAYMSDAGYPGISDPGYLLVKEAIKSDIAVSTINGSCAFINALVGSGLATNHFYFHGFMSAKNGEASKELENLSKKTETLVFYEAPHRIERTIKLFLKFFGNREAAICRELTKINEEFIRGTLEEISTLDFSSLKGEMVIVVSGNINSCSFDEKKIVERINYFLEKGLSKKDTAEIVSEEFSLNKNLIKDYLPK